MLTKASTMASGKMARNKDKECLYIPTRISTQATGIKAKNMVKELTSSMLLE